MPGTSFANIDREQWWGLTGGTETGVIDVGPVPEEQAVQLRLAYLRHRPSWMRPTDAWELPTWLDGILVVDEVRAAGDTLRIADGLVRRAFPDCEVQTAHWMAPAVQRDKAWGVAQQIENPVWYSDDTVAGRLVGNRMDPNHRGAHWRGRIAPLFMSTVPRERDIAVLHRRLEAAGLAREVASGRLLAAPAATRDIDDAAERIESLYGYTDPWAFTAASLAQS